MHTSIDRPPSRTWRYRLHPGRVDATSLLTIYFGLLLFIPAAMKIAPLGSAGAPANVLAMLAFAWWAWFHLQRTEPLAGGVQPVRAAMLGWLLVMLVVYVHATALPIPAEEVTSADSGMLRLVGFAGILLVANDGLVSAERTRTVVRRLVIAVGLVAVLGLVQLVTGQLWVDRLSIPGLTSAAGGELARRSGLARPSGTSTHPIEYGVLLSMMLPLAIAFARQAPARRWAYRLLVGAMAFAIFLAISRSAIVCSAVAVVVMCWAWPVAARLRALAFLLLIFVLVYLTVPGLLGTIGRLFTGVAQDSSVASRTGSYEVAAQFIERSPVLGRGFGTFLPTYWILDNGYLGLLIEGGVLGLAGLIVLIVVALSAARRAAALTVDNLDREIAVALVAAIAAGAAGLAFFDTFGFPQTAGCFFVLLGLSGGLRRLAVGAAQPPTGPKVGPGATVDGTSS